MSSNNHINRSAIFITHGTDTLAWTHAAVRYTVKKNIVNIAITGGQIPMPDGVGTSIFTVFNNGQNVNSDSPVI